MNQSVLRTKGDLKYFIAMGLSIVLISGLGQVPSMYANAGDGVTLDDLIVPGAEIIVGDKRFDNFRVTENSVNGDVTGRTQVNLGNIQVISWNDDPLNPGIQFVSLGNELRIMQAGPTPTGELDLDIVFRVSTLDGQPKIKDNSLVAFFDGTPFQTDPFQTDHFAEVRERLFQDAALTIPVRDLSSTPIEKDTHRQVDASGGINIDESGVVVGKEFAPRSEVWVLKDLRIETANQAEFAEVRTFEQHFSQVAKPVGGEFLPIDASALLVAGAQANAMWILSALVIGSVAFGTLYLTTKKN